jgi:hypothetical protein
LRQFGKGSGELVERGAAPRAGDRIDAEIDAGGGSLGGRDPVRHGCLHGDVLKVAGPGMEQERQLAVVDRHLGEHRGNRTEPERQASALVPDLAAHEVGDVGRRRAAQLAEKEPTRDVCHDVLPVVSSW